MKAPRESTVEYVYAMLKNQVIQFIQSEIEINLDFNGGSHNFDETEKVLYDMLCVDLIREIDKTEIDYQAVITTFQNEETPF